MPVNYEYDNLHGVGLAPSPFNDLSLSSQLFVSPAAGADFKLTVPDTGGIWELVALSFQLVTSSAVANRGLTLNVKDHDGNIVFHSSFSTAITASLTILVSAGPVYASGVGDITTTKVVGLALPEGPYLPGWTINSLTNLIDTGDQFSKLALWFKQLQSVPNAPLNGG